MKSGVQLRRVALINPVTPEFAAATGEVTFVPLECVWPRGRADFTRRAQVEEVANGYSRFRAGDVLLPKVTPTFQAGRSTVASINTALGAASTEVHVLRETDRSSARYLAYLGQSRLFISEGETVVEGVGNLLRVPTEWVKSFRIPMLARQRQEAIANFLDRETAQIDAMIEAQQWVVDKLRERHDAIWVQAYASILASSPLRQVRNCVTSLVDGPFGSALTSAHYTDEGVRVIRLGNVGVNVFRSGDKAFIDAEYGNSLSQYCASAGDVVMAGLGDTHQPVGRACVVPEGIEPAIVKADCYRLRPRQDVCARYLAWALSCPLVLAQTRKLARGTTRQRMNITLANSIRVAVPPLATQRETLTKYDFASERLSAAWTAAQRVIKLLRERREALITAAVMGRIDPATGIEWTGASIEEAS